MRSEHWQAAWGTYQTINDQPTRFYIKLSICCIYTKRRVK